MALDVCFADLIKAGKIPAEKLEGAGARYARMVQEYQSGMGKSAAEAMATDKVIKWLERDTFQRNLDRLRMAKKQGAWLADMKIKSSSDVLDSKIAVSKLARIDKQMDAVRNGRMASLDGFLAKFRRNVFGVVREKAELEPIGRAIFGEKIDDVNANEMAQGIAQEIENTRLMRNSVGGYIGKIDNYLPQSHDARAVRGAGDYINWRDFGPIDRVRVMDHETGEFITGIAREARLRGVHESIITESANSLTPGAVGKGSLANARSDPRSLHFANYDDWAEYNAKFGTKDSLYDIVVGHISSMSRDIALMDALGPNPEAMIRFQKEAISKSIGMRGSEVDRKNVNQAVNRLQDIYNELTLNNRGVDNARLALASDVGMGIQVASKLGGAAVSAIPDFATFLFQSRVSKLPLFRGLQRYVELWNPFDSSARELAVQLRLTTDDWLSASASTARWTGEELTSEFANRISSGIIRASGLARHTRNLQMAHGMNWVGYLTNLSKSNTAYDNLDAMVVDNMRRFDIGPKEWDVYRATVPTEKRGARWIMPSDIGDQRVANLFTEMMLSDTNLAVMSSEIRTRSFINSQGRRGTFKGEAMRHALLFKAFPIAVFQLHGRRMMEQADISNKAMYGMTLATLMTMGGALSVQLGNLFAGKDVENMNDRKFLAHAILKGGSLGIPGDLLNNSERTFKQNALFSAMGPTWGGTFVDVIDLVGGNLISAIDGDGATKTNVAKEAVKMGIAHTPGQNLWYTRLAQEMTWKRLLREWADPDIADADERVRVRAEAEGTGLWADPSLGAEGIRAPDLGNAWQGDEEADGGDALQYLPQ